MGKNLDIKLAVNWITGELFAVLNNKNLEISQSPISAKNLAKLINLIKNGKEKLFGFFVGQAMKVSGGKANPQLINEILKKKL